MHTQSHILSLSHTHRSMHTLTCIHTYTHTLIHTQTNTHTAEQRSGERAFGLVGQVRLTHTHTHTHTHVRVQNKLRKLGGGADFTERKWLANLFRLSRSDSREQQKPVLLLLLRQLSEAQKLDFLQSSAQRMSIPNGVLVFRVFAQLCRKRRHCICDCCATSMLRFVTRTPHPHTHSAHRSHSSSLVCKTTGV